MKSVNLTILSAGILLSILGLVLGNFVLIPGLICLLIFFIQSYLNAITQTTKIVTGIGGLVTLFLLLWRIFIVFQLFIIIESSKF